MVPFSQNICLFPHTLWYHHSWHLFSDFLWQSQCSAAPVPQSSTDTQRCWCETKQQQRLKALSRLAPYFSKAVPTSVRLKCLWNWGVSVPRSTRECSRNSSWSHPFVVLAIWSRNPLNIQDKGQIKEQSLLYSGCSACSIMSDSRQWFSGSRGFCQLALIPKAGSRPAAPLAAVAPPASRVGAAWTPNTKGVLPHL